MKTKKSFKLSDFLVNHYSPSVEILRELFMCKVDINPWKAYFELKSYWFWKRVFIVIYALILTSSALLNLANIPRLLTWDIGTVVLILVLIGVRENPDRSKVIKLYEKVFSDFLDLVEVFSKPVHDNYQGRLGYNKEVLWEVVRAELVNRAKNIIIVEERIDHFRNTPDIGFKGIIADVAIKGLTLAREQFKRTHTIALKYELAEKEWNSYFDVAKGELAKDSK